jgi:hypothetical protein
VHSDFSTLSGIAAVIGAICGPLCVAIGFLNRQRFSVWLKSRINIIRERDEAMADAKSERDLRQEAEASATWSERTANEARQAVNLLDQRVGLLESQARRDAARSERRDALYTEMLGYTRRLLEWAVRVEQVARLGGIELDPVPPVPTGLMQRLHVIEPHDIDTLGS